MKTYKQGAMALFNKGFEPIPIKTASKFPAVTEWQKRLIDHKQVDTWSNNGLGTCGIGIRLGTVCSIDVDTPNQEISTQMLQHITDLNEAEPLYRVGQKPKFCVPFYNTEGLTKQVSKAYSDDHGNKLQLEILATGQQFVAHGIHPGTGNEYQWFNGSLEELFSNQSLPEFDELTLLSLIDFFEELCESKGCKELTNKRPKTPSTASAATGDPFIDEQRRPSKEELISKLKSIDPVQYDYDQDGWFTIITSIHWSTYGSEEGLEIAKAWSKQSPLWRDGAPDIEVRWNSLSLNREGNLITFATICDIAIFSENELSIENHSNVADVADVADAAHIAPCSTSYMVATSERLTTPKINLTGYVREWIEEYPADFTTENLYRELNARTTAEKSKIRVVLARLCEEGLIKKSQGTRGVYQVAQSELKILKPTTKQMEPLPLPLPVGLSKYIQVMPGNIIVIAGETNAGKTTLAMEILAAWTPIFYPLATLKGPPVGINKNSNTSCLRTEHDSVEPAKDKRMVEIADVGFRYLSSEMDEVEIGHNLVNMEKGTAALVEDKVQFVERAGAYGSAVLKDGITILDFLEIHDRFYEIGSIIKEIADNTGKGITIILVQLKKGSLVARGGDFGLERARTAISIVNMAEGYRSCYVAKCKYPVAGEKPQDKFQDFMFDEETRKAIPVGPMRYMNEKERAAKVAEYKRIGTDTLFKGDFESDKTPKH